MTATEGMSTLVRYLVGNSTRMNTVDLADCEMAGKPSNEMIPTAAGKPLELII